MKGLDIIIFVVRDTLRTVLELPLRDYCYRRFVGALNSCDLKRARESETFYDPLIYLYMRIAIPY